MEFNVKKFLKGSLISLAVLGMIGGSLNGTANAKHRRYHYRYGRRYRARRHSYRRGRLYRKRTRRTRRTRRIRRTRKSRRNHKARRHSYKYEYVAPKTSHYHAKRAKKARYMYTPYYNYNNGDKHYARVQITKVVHPIKGETDANSTQYYFKTNNKGFIKSTGMNTGIDWATDFFNSDPASNNDAINNTNTPSTTGLSAFRSEELQDINNDRNSVGVDSVSEDPSLDSLAQERAHQIRNNFTHYDANGNFIFLDDAAQKGINMGTAQGECIDDNGVDKVGSSSADVSNKDFWNDEKGSTPSQDGIHHQITRKPTYTRVGIGAFAPKGDYTTYVVENFAN